MINGMEAIVFCVGVAVFVAVGVVGAVCVCGIWHCWRLGVRNEEV